MWTISENVDSTFLPVLHVYAYNYQQSHARLLQLHWRFFFPITAIMAMTYRGKVHVKSHRAICVNRDTCMLQSYTIPSHTLRPVAKTSNWLQCINTQCSASVHTERSTMLIIHMNIYKRIKTFLFLRGWNRGCGSFLVCHYCCNADTVLKCCFCLSLSVFLWLCPVSDSQPQSHCFLLQRKTTSQIQTYNFIF